MKKQNSQKLFNKTNLSQNKNNTTNQNIIPAPNKQTIIKQLQARNRTPTGNFLINNNNHHQAFYSPRAMNQPSYQKTFENGNIKQIYLRSQKDRQSQIHNTQNNLNQEKTKENLTIQVNQNVQSHRIVGKTPMFMNSPKFIIESQNNHELKHKITDLETKLKSIRKDYHLKNQQTKQQFKPNHKNKSKQNIKQNKEKQIELRKPSIHIIEKSKTVANLHSPKRNSQDNLNKNPLKYQNQQTNMTSYFMKSLEDRQNHSPNFKQNLQHKKNNQSELKQYATVQNPKMTLLKLSNLPQSISENNILKHKSKDTKNQKTIKKQLSRQYYISSILNAFDDRKLICQNSTKSDQLVRNHLITSIQILKYLKNAKSATTAVDRKLSVSSLPPPWKQKTIVLDLDETLIHCNENTIIPHDVALSIKFPNSTIKAGINIRPHAQQFLKELSTHFQLIIYTASHQVYANVIIDYLDPKKQFISHRFFRDSCTKTEEGFYLKDLRVIDRNLKNMLLVDNAAYSYFLQPQNGVPIIPFYDSKTDTQLKKLLTYLKKFIRQEDMKNKNSQTMKINHYSSFNDWRNLINQLYL